MVKTRSLGAAGYCDSCNKPCITLCQAGSPDINDPGIPCYHCKEGRFRHRGLWYLITCPYCEGKDYGCEKCSGDGRVPVAIE